MKEKSLSKNHNKSARNAKFNFYTLEARLLVWITKSVIPNYQKINSKSEHMQQSEFSLLQKR